MGDLKANVELLARLQVKTELEVITALQVGAVFWGNDELLDELCALKWDYIK